MTATLDKKASAAQDYKEFIASLVLYTIGLAELTSKIDRDKFWIKDDEHSNNYKVSNKTLDVGDNYLDIRSTLTLEVIGQQSKSIIIKIVASYDLHFHATVKSKDIVEKFSDSDLLLIVMPYFRELVTNITAKMYVPPIILPLSNEASSHR